MSDTITPSNPFHDPGSIAELAADQIVHPDIHNDTLGLYEVGLGERVTKLVLNDEKADDADHQEKIDDAVWELSHDLGGIRESFEDLARSQKEVIGAAIYASMSPFHKSYIEQIWKDRAVANAAPGEKPKIIEDYKDALDWLVGESDANLLGESQQHESEYDMRFADRDQKLLNFLQSHKQHITERQQDDEFLVYTEHYKIVWTQGVEQGIEEGWLDASARDRLAKLHSIKFYEGDYFSTHLKERLGYYPLDSGQVVIARQHEDIAPHEINHVLLGDRSLLKSKEELTGFDQMWLDEAITEHIAMVFAKDGLQDVEDLNLEVGVYKPERKILYGLITVAQERGIDIKMADFTKAYSATGEERHEQIEKIENKLVGLFGGEPVHDGVLTVVQRIINANVSNWRFHPKVFGRARVELMTGITKEMIDKMIAPGARKYATTPKLVAKSQ